MTDQPRGVIAPILTPFEADGRIALDLYADHAQWLLAEGCHYLSPFGTTGEALSVPLAARMAALEHLVVSGIPAERLMPGTGLCSPEDTGTLTAHAVSLGCAGAMTLPAFFYPGLPEDGHYRYFASLIEAVGPRLKLCLYHIPQNAGVGIAPSLAGRLARDFPEVVVALKDSSGDWQNTLAVVEAAPSLSVFPGSETLLVEGASAGTAGCISATCNLNARAIRAVYEAGGAADDAEIRRFRETVQKAGYIGPQKAALAMVTADDRWLNVLPPHLNATRAEGQALLDALGPLADPLRGIGRAA